MEFRWEALTLRGAGGRVELRLVRTAGAVEVTMVPYDGPDGSRYVVEVRRKRDDAGETATDSRETAEAGDVRETPRALADRGTQRPGDGRWRTVRTVGTTEDFSTGLAMVVDAVIDVECGPSVA